MVRLEFREYIKMVLTDNIFDQNHFIVYTPNKDIIMQL